MDSILDFYRKYDILINFILIIAAVFLCVAGFVAITQLNTCNAYADMGITVQYNFWTGCMANHPVFGWMPTSEYFKTINLNVPQ